MRNAECGAREENSRAGRAAAAREEDRSLSVIPHAGFCFPHLAGFFVDIVAAARLNSGRSSTSVRSDRRAGLTWFLHGRRSVDVSRSRRETVDVEGISAPLRVASAALCPAAPEK